MERQRKVGIMGGTFDPIHNGHLLLAEEAYRSFELDSILFIPNGNPPHKPGQVQTDIEHRIKMTELAIMNKPYFEVSNYEQVVSGYHYTYATLEYLTNEHKNTTYFFILGADSLVNFHTWKYPERICACCEILVATRDHMNLEELEVRMKEATKRYGGIFHRLQTQNIDISSSEIRGYFKNQREYFKDVPEKVRNYIQEQGLYED